jgi:hypothetical protein
MTTSPFKFLDSYTREDRDIFFGREREIEELSTTAYSRAKSCWCTAYPVQANPP